MNELREKFERVMRSMLAHSPISSEGVAEDAADRLLKAVCEVRGCEPSQKQPLKDVLAGKGPCTWCGKECKEKP